MARVDEGGAVRLARQDGLNGRALDYPRGRVLGGCSSINGMMANRGSPHDYADWGERGAAGWGWDDVLPFFKKMESDRDFDGPFHGTDGPIGVRRLFPDIWPGYTAAIMDAAKAEVDLAKLRLEQLERLAEQDVARPDEVKRARADVEIAASRYLTAVEDRKLRQLDLSRYEMQLKRRNIYAPFDGVVSEIFHQPGEYITPADPAVVRLVVLDELYAVFNIPAQDINVFEVGSKVSLVLTTTPKPVTGIVDAITPQIDGESGTIKIQVVIKNHTGKFRAGDRCR